MAINKRRYINTKFWNDTYVSDLDPIEKLLFIYFLTNEHTNISGVYEVPLKVIALETGIDRTMVEKILPRLSDKVGYIGGLVVVKNFLKHQETKSEQTIKGILNCWTEIGVEKIKNLIEKGVYDISDSEIEGVYRGHIGVPKYLDSNLDLDSNSSEEASQEIPVLIKSFEGINSACKNFYGNTTQRKACQDLIDTHSFEKVKSIIENTLPKTNKMQYFPTITTPVQLRDKWATLESAVIKFQSEKISKEKKYKVAFTS
jgi:hypothetical protein